MKLSIKIIIFLYSILLFGCQDNNLVGNRQSEYSKPFELSADSIIDDDQSIDLDKSISSQISQETTEKDFEFTTRKNSNDNTGIDLIIVVDNSYSMHLRAPLYFYDHPKITQTNPNGKRFQSFSDKIQLIADQVKTKIADGDNINLTIITALSQRGFNPKSDGMSTNKSYNNQVLKNSFPDLPKIAVHWSPKFHIGRSVAIYDFHYTRSNYLKRINNYKKGLSSTTLLRFIYNHYYPSFFQAYYVSRHRVSDYEQFIPSVITQQRILKTNVNFEDPYTYYYKAAPYKPYKNPNHKPCVDTMHKNYSIKQNTWEFSGARYNMKDLNKIYKNNASFFKSLKLNTKDSSIYRIFGTYDFFTPYNLDPMFLDAPFYYLDKDFVENILDNTDTDTNINIINCIIEPFSALKVLDNLVDSQKFENIQSSTTTYHSDIFTENYQKVFLVMSDSFSPSQADLDRLVIKKNLKTSIRTTDNIDTKKQFQQSANEAFGRSNVSFYSYSPKQHIGNHVDQDYKKLGSGAIRYTGYPSDKENLQRTSSSVRSNSTLIDAGFPAFSHAIEHIKYGRYYSPSYRDLSVYFNGDTTGHYSFDDLDFITGVRDNILQSPSDITSMVNKYLLHDAFSTRDYQILKVTVDDIEISQDKYYVDTESASSQTFITFVDGVLDHSKDSQKVVVTARLEAVDE